MCKTSNKKSITKNCGNKNYNLRINTNVNWSNNSNNHNNNSLKNNSKDNSYNGNSNGNVIVEIVDRRKYYNCGNVSNLTRDSPEQDELNLCENIDQSQVDKLIGNNDTTIIYTVIYIDDHTPVIQSLFNPRHC